jgi:hypothetical protein
MCTTTLSFFSCFVALSFSHEICSVALHSTLSSFPNAKKYSDAGWHFEHPFGGRQIEFTEPSHPRLDKNGGTILSSLPPPTYRDLRPRFHQATIAVCHRAAAHMPEPTILRSRTPCRRRRRIPWGSRPYLGAGPHAAAATEPDPRAAAATRPCVGARPAVCGQPQAAATELDPRAAAGKLASSSLLPARRRRAHCLPRA